jgi:hypothetical protein
VTVLLQCDKHFLGMALALKWWVKESNSAALLTEPIEIRTEWSMGEVLFPEPGREEVDLTGGMSRRERFVQNPSR